MLKYYVVYYVLIRICSVFIGEPNHFKSKHDLHFSRGLCSFNLFIKPAGLHFDIF